MEAEFRNIDSNASDHQRKKFETPSVNNEWSIYNIKVQVCWVDDVCYLRLLLSFVNLFFWEEATTYNKR